jgi:cell division protein FtsQ
MAGRSRQGRARPRERAAAAVVRFPRRGRVRRARGELRRVAPSGRSLAVAFALLLTGVGAYVGARESSLFAVREIEVSGAPPAVARAVRGALAPAAGESLVALDLPALVARVEAVPTVARVTLDRAFPHRLVAVVTPERPVAVVRRGAGAWLVAHGGRVIARLRRPGRSALPRIWVPRTTDLTLGAPVAQELRPLVTVAAALAGAGFPARVATVSARGGELALRLRSGLELRLGDTTQLELKLAVAARVLPELDGSEDYLDVTVPQRVVAGSVQSQPQVEVDAEAGESVS